MATDLLDNLLEMEQDFYQQGFSEGVADSTHAGLVEGKLFGIEKGYEKGLELGKLRGRALLWQARLALKPSRPESTSKESPILDHDKGLNKADSFAKINSILPPLQGTDRLHKNVDSLVMLTNDANLDRSNIDEAVEAFDERISRARAKAKVIATVVDESLNPVGGSERGIEDAAGLQARH